ncbi:MAG: hypothetical protein H5T64_02620 [Chloroflexi bacterium]|nr:hypothetical protein [Chloroflexota bacterium]
MPLVPFDYYSVSTHALRRAMTRNCIAALRYNYIIRHSDNVHYTIAISGLLRGDYNPWHIFKMVVDMETNAYVRVLLNQGVYLAGDYKARSLVRVRGLPSLLGLR